MDLAQFLLARNAEDKGIAESTGGKHGGICWSAFGGEDQPETIWVRSRWDTKRVLAECEQKQRLIEQCRSILARPLDLTSRELVAFARGVLLDMALPFKQHPDYAEAFASIVISKRPLTEADIAYGQRVAAQLDADRESGRAVDPSDPWRFTVPEPTAESKE